MRDIKYIVVHCTATPIDTKVSSILNYWKEEKGWRNPGYHRIIDKEGNVTPLQHFDKPSNGVRGHNHESIHISYIGGYKGVDTRTEKQKASLLRCLHEALTYAPNAIIQGHRDFDGVTKSCPSFDAKKEYSWLTA